MRIRFLGSDELVASKWIGCHFEPFDRGSAGKQSVSVESTDTFAVVISTLPVLGADFPA